MDETEKTAQDNSSDGDKGNTSEKETETYTKKQMDELETKIRSDAKSEIGRLVKSAEASAKTTQAIGDRFSRYIKDQDDRDLETNKDDPEELKKIRGRQTDRETSNKLADKEQELEEVKVKLTEAERITGESTKERNAREVATQHNVDVETLMKFTDGSKEAMEELAKGLNKGSAKPPLKSDSSVTTGVTVPDTARGKIKAGWDELHR